MTQNRPFRATGPMIEYHVKGFWRAYPTRSFTLLKQWSPCKRPRNARIPAKHVGNGSLGKRPGGGGWPPNLLVRRIIDIPFQFRAALIQIHSDIHRQHWSSSYLVAFRYRGDVVHVDAMQFPIMARTIRDDQLVVRISRSLRAELEAAASADSRGLSSMVRRVLIDWASRRVIDRQTQTVA
jgi:hypothetical protein